MGQYSGYHDCPCRDCFEIAIGEDGDGNPALCNACESAECDASGGSECNAAGHDDDCALLCPAHLANEKCRTLHHCARCEEA